MNGNCSEMYGRGRESGEGDGSKREGRCNVKEGKQQEKGRESEVGWK